MGGVVPGGDWITPTTPDSNRGTSVCTAATRYLRKRAGSFSSLSSDSQATGVLLSESHCASRVVLPKPAGAEMSVRGPRHPLYESRGQLRAAHEGCAGQGSIKLGCQQWRGFAPHPTCGGRRRGNSNLSLWLWCGFDERSSQGLGHRLEPRQCEGLSEVVGGELAVLRAVGFPVPAPPPPLVACTLFARCEWAGLAGKGKGGGSLQPGIPGGRFHQEYLFLLLVLIGQRVASDDRGPLRHGSSSANYAA